MNEFIKKYKFELIAYLVFIPISIFISYIIQSSYNDNKSNDILIKVKFKFSEQYIDAYTKIDLELNSITKVTKFNGYKELINYALHAIPTSEDSFINIFNDDKSITSVEFGKYFKKYYPKYDDNIKFWGKIEKDTHPSENIDIIAWQIPVKSIEIKDDIIEMLNINSKATLTFIVNDLLNKLNSYINYQSNIVEDFDNIEFFNTYDQINKSYKKYIKKIDNIELFNILDTSIQNDLDYSIFVVLPLLAFILISFIILLQRLIYELFIENKS